MAGTGPAMAVEGRSFRWSCQGLTLAPKNSLSTKMPMQLSRIHLVHEVNFISAA
jgi:hypothetical protein